ncbi:hypothetical protein B0T24DRAFT_591455 [Lasiosphaeria ovina]|uniref:Uncharacterized protein n=1 Tax=Lasiosphaeria ovina TaxID=92902 RepID=A0AAE0KGW2_9PEZI|nr:hypothetical protein B0T24DRAFT_591455 [Lasiosphaeria ovina]
MGGICSHTVVTVAPTSAETVTEGFLHRRMQHFHCSFPWRRNDTSCSVFFRHPIAKNHSEIFEKAYAKRQLTYDMNRLPAIGAIAKYFQASLNDEYLAGLWKVHTPRLECRYDQALFTPKSATPSTGITALGPSWSWAGVDSITGLRWPLINAHPDFTARVVSTEILDKPSGEFGHVGAGKLVLNARYENIHLRLDGKRAPVRITDPAPGLRKDPLEIGQDWTGRIKKLRICLY